MILQPLSYCTLILALLAVGLAHDHDFEQMPPGYVKFPYQAVYAAPGLDEGDFH